MVYHLLLGTMPGMFYVNYRRTLAYGAWQGTLLLHAVNAPDTAATGQPFAQDDTCAQSGMYAYAGRDDLLV